MKKRKDGQWLKTKIINGEHIYLYSTVKTEHLAKIDIDNQFLQNSTKKEIGRMFCEVSREWWDIKEPTLAEQSSEHITKQKIEQMKNLRM